MALERLNMCTGQCEWTGRAFCCRCTLRDKPQSRVAVVKKYQRPKAGLLVSCRTVMSWRASERL